MRSTSKAAIAAPAMAIHEKKRIGKINRSAGTAASSSAKGQRPIAKAQPTMSGASSARSAAGRRLSRRRMSSAPAQAAIPM